MTPRSPLSVSDFDWMCPDCSRVVESRLAIFETDEAVKHHYYSAKHLRCSCGRVVNPLSIHPRYIVKVEEEGAKFLLPEKVDYLRLRCRILSRIA